MQHGRRLPETFAEGGEFSLRDIGRDAGADRLRVPFDECAALTQIELRQPWQGINRGRGASGARGVEAGAFERRRHARAHARQRGQERARDEVERRRMRVVLLVADGASAAG